jgi:RNA polymerase sigma-70 factor (ECF subfamily)
MNNAEDAEEITQDVFLAVFQGIEKFNQQAKISTWIYRITLNKCIDAVRAKNTKKRFALITSIYNKVTGELQYDFPTYHHPGVEAENKEAFNHLYMALSKLPENQKKVIILLKVEQLSQQETADIMNIGVKAVESLFQRAKINLKKILDKQKGKEIR